MERAAGRHAAGGRYQAGMLPRRSAAGAAQARAHLEHRGKHWAPGAGGLSWATDPGILRRVRDALASGMRP